MKSKLLIISIILVIISSFNSCNNSPSAPAAPTSTPNMTQTVAAAITIGYTYLTWHEAGTSGLPDRVVQSARIAAGSLGPYIAFIDAAYGYKATVMKLEAGAWVTVGSEGLTPGLLNSPSLAVNNNTPYLLFCDAENGNKATLFSFNGSGWSSVGTQGFSPGQAKSTRLAFSNNTPYAAFVDATDGHRVRVMSFDGNSWNTLGTAGYFVSGYPDYFSFSVDNGTPYVAFADDANSFRTTLIKYTGSGWVTVGSAGFDANYPSMYSLGINNGTPYIAFTGVSSGVKKFDGINWVTAGNQYGSSPGNVSMVFYNDSLFISSIDTLCSYKAGTKKLGPDTSWTIEGNDCYTPVAGSGLCTAICGNTIYAAYLDTSGTNKINVMKKNVP